MLRPPFAISFILLCLVEIITYSMWRGRIGQLELFVLHGSKPDDLDVNLTASIVFASVGSINAVVATFIQVGSIAWLRYETKTKLQKTLASSRGWLVSTRVHWGPTKNGSEIRVANAVEGALALLTCPTLSAGEQSALNNAIDFVAGNVMADGLHSLTLKFSTVHCTAMGLYLFELLREKQLLPVGVGSVIFDQLRDALIKSYGVRGWGFRTDATPQAPEDVRLFSSLWALRALSKSSFQGTHEFNSALLSITNQVPKYLFGFRYGDSAKVSMLALFRLLVTDLSARAQSMTLTTTQLRAIEHRILRELEKGSWIEVEEYRSRNLPHFTVEKLSWNHIAIGLGLEALSCNYHERPLAQRIRIRYIIRRVLESIHPDGFMVPKLISFEESNPLIFPTTYVLAGLQAIENSVQKHKLAF